MSRKTLSDTENRRVIVGKEDKTFFVKTMNFLNGNEVLTNKCYLTKDEIDGIKEYAESE